MAQPHTATTAYHREAAAPKPGTWDLLITCEHGGNRIPHEYLSYFADCDAMLETHQGYDAGALELAQHLARAFSAPLMASTVSRLLVDLNRSLGHRALHLSTLLDAPRPVRRQIIDQHYLPYRKRAEAWIREQLDKQHGVIHLSSHSFTPRLNGETRNADIGLLYDPRRHGEVSLCRAWQTQLRALAPTLKVRRNYPYRGISDGFTTYLRRRFPAACYLGIEIEINQRRVDAPAEEWTRLLRILSQALDRAMTETGFSGAAKQASPLSQ